MNYHRVFGWVLFITFGLMFLLTIVLATILLTSETITPHTYCLPGYAANDTARYGECVPCGINRYSADGIFCLACPSGTYTCTDISDSISACGSCSNFVLDPSTNTSICNSCVNKNFKFFSSYKLTAVFFALFRAG
jgi:hypothetical protein